MSGLYTVEQAAEQLREAIRLRDDAGAMYPWAVGMVQGLVVGGCRPCEDVLADITAVVDAVTLVSREIQDTTQ